MITLDDITDGAIKVSVDEGTTTFQITGDRAELENVDPIIFTTGNFPKTEIIVNQHIGNEIVERMLTRSDTGTVIVIDDDEILSNYIIGKYVWLHQMDVKTNTKGCVNFTLNTNEGVEHYLIAYRPKGQQNTEYRLQRFRIFDNIGRIGLKLFDKEGTEFSADSFYTTTDTTYIDMKVYGIASDDIIEGHTKLGKLLV